MKKIYNNMYEATYTHEWEWMHNNKVTGYLNEEQKACLEAWWKEDCEKRRIAEKKEKRQIYIITAIAMVVFVLLIWGLLAAIADASGVGVGSVLFAILFFPAILAAAKGC